MTSEVERNVFYVLVKHIKHAMGQGLVSKVFCSAVTPRTCTDLDRVCNKDDGEFEFVYDFNNHLNPFRSFL